LNIDIINGIYETLKLSCYFTEKGRWSFKYSSYRSKI